MELENTQNNALAKLPMLKLREYEMWEIRIKQYFQIQDYALWEVIENGNSWVPIPVTAPETGPSTATKMTVPSTAEEKICKKNDVKARSLLLMALPNEHQLTFDQYVDAQSMFAAIKARFGGNEATKKTQKAMLKQQYENFNALSSESLDSIFNRLQKLVSRLAILGVVTPPEDLNVKFLRSLPSEWNTHVKVKKSVGTNNDDKNLAFLTTSGASSTNNINTVNPEVSTGTTKVNTASTEISTASFSDATVYAFLSTQPQGSQLVHEDLEQLHDDDLEEMDLKWNMALLSISARKFYQRTGKKIIINGSNNAGYDKSKVECSSSKAVRIKDAFEKAMCAIDGAGFDWIDMAEEEIQANMALMAFSDSEVKNDKSCSKSCLKNYEALKKQYDGLLVKLDDTGFKASTYKRGLSILEEQILKYKESEVLFSEEIAFLKRSVGLEEFKELEVNEYGPRNSSLKPTIGCDKESNNSKENTDDSLEQHQKTDTKTSSVKSSLKVDKDWKKKFFCLANHVREVEPKKVRENNYAPIIEEWVSDDEDEVESPVVVKKKNVIPTAAKIEKPVKKTVRYAEMYRSQRPRGNQRNWNGQKSNQLGSDFVMNNKACFVCGSFDHLKKDCGKRIIKPVWKNTRRVNDHYSTRMTHSNPRRNMIPQAVLMRSGIKAVNVAKPKAVHNAVKRNWFHDVKASACWVWRPKQKEILDNVSKHNSASMILKRLDYIDAQGRFKWMHRLMEGDFPRLHLNDIEDMLLLVVQNKLFNKLFNLRGGKGAAK
ncbi:hypothetical protein Tco_1012698, partial [Tanacetum coccineum]